MKTKPHFPNGIKFYFRKISGFLHLWLGLLSGLVVFIVCTTAAIWSFSPEIESATQSYRHIPEEKNKRLIPVSRLRAVADRLLKEKKTRRLNFEGHGKAVVADFYGEENGENYYWAAYLNPYTGEVLKLQNENRSFFRIIIQGHYSLWMGDFGSAIVKWATLIFLIMLISGIILWWPKNKAARRQRYKLKFGVSPKRLNYDLHNVLGFYASWALLFAVLSGLVWTFDSVRNASFFLASGGVQMPEYPNPVSKSPTHTKAYSTGLDSTISTVLETYSSVNHMSVGFPDSDSGVYSISVYPDRDYYSGDEYYIDQRSFAQIPVSFYGKYRDANGGERLSRMNYDIHVGSIIGLPGRIVMFLAVLVGASLPVTGFYIWWGKRKRNKKSHRQPPVARTRYNLIPTEA